MNSFELNKIIGGFLAAVFVVFTIGLVSDAIFHEEVPEQAGYAIEAAEDGADAGPAEEEAPVPIGQLLATGNAEAGANVFRKCASCHSAEKGGPNKVGPDLWGTVGRAIASHEGFSYSQAMQDYAAENGDWGFENLNAFLLSPKGEVPGTAMGFVGLKSEEDRANILVWLNQQSDNPLPLPEPEPETASEEAPSVSTVEGASPPEGTAGAGDEQPQAESSGAAEGTGDPAGASPARSTTEAAPSSEAGDINAAPNAVEGTGEPLDENGDADAGEQNAGTNATTGDDETSGQSDTTAPDEAPTAEQPQIEEEPETNQ